MAHATDYLFGPIVSAVERASIGTAVVVRPYDAVRHDPPDSNLDAIWCAASSDDGVLFQLVNRSLPVANVLDVPLAIYSATREFPLSVAGLARRQDQFWMHCERRPHEPLDLLRFRYLHEIEYSPLAGTVMLVAVADNDARTAENILLCGHLAPVAPVVGLVWRGEPSPAAREALEELAQGVPWASRTLREAR